MEISHIDGKSGGKKNLLTGNYRTKFTNFFKFVSEIKSEKDLV